MTDKGIPPPNFNFRKDNLPIEEQILNDAEDSFTDYMSASKRNADEDREEMMQETINREAKNKEARRSSLIFEEMEASAELEDAEEESELEEEEKMSEREADLDERHTQSTSRRRASERTEETAEDAEFQELEAEEEETRPIQDNRFIRSDGEESALKEEDPLQAAKKEIKAEKEELSDEIEGAQEHDLEHETHKTKRAHHKPQQKETAKENEGKKDAPKASKGQPTTANIHSGVEANLSAQAASASKAKSKPEKSKLQSDFEKLAGEILAEAQVLENGDVIETTISLNMEGSIFDQGEVTVTAYKYRPLEVNLKFKKFKSDASKLMKQNAETLRKDLKEKSLKVHQLDIIEG